MTLPKILLVANTDWYLYNYRLSLAKYLRQRAFEVILVSPTGRYVPLIQAEGFTWLNWPVGRRSVSPWSEALAIARLLHIYRQYKPGLVHHFTIKPVLYGSLAAWLSGVPAVVNAITGLGYLFLNDRWLTRMVRSWVLLAYRWLLNRPNTAVIFENEANREQFIRAGLMGADRSWLIEGVGVDVERFSPTPEPEGVPVVLFPARLLREKGIYTLVEAARLLKPRCSVKFRLAGEVDEGNPGSVRPAEVQQWMEEGLVEWLGWQADMPAVYAQSHLVVLPSWGEGIPTALLEAGACARPVVATDVAGCRDVVVDGFNGLLVPPQDAVALAAAIERLVSDPTLRATLGVAGRERVLQHFTDETINQKTFEVYQSLLKLV